jgi:hypothetical protein
MPNASFVALDSLDHAQGLTRSDLVLPHVLELLARVEEAPTPWPQPVRHREKRRQLTFRSLPALTRLQDVPGTI